MVIFRVLSNNISPKVVKLDDTRNLELYKERVEILLGKLLLELGRHAYVERAYQFFK